MQYRTTKIFLLAALLLTAIYPAAVSADDLKWHLEAFGGRFFGENDLDEDFGVYGLRFGRRFGEHWGAELSFSRLDEDFSGVEYLFADLSAKRFLNDGEKVDFYLSGGIGDFRVSFGDNVFFEEEDDAFGVHLGFGLEADFGERFFVRPEIKQRWIDQDGFDDLHGEATFSLGIRL